MNAFLFDTFQRFGVALVPTGVLNLKNKKFAVDYRVLDENCECSTCTVGCSRAYLRFAMPEPVAAIYLTYHNVHYQVNTAPCPGENRTKNRREWLFVVPFKNPKEKKNSAKSRKQVRFVSVKAARAEMYPQCDPGEECHRWLFKPHQ